MIDPAAPRDARSTNSSPSICPGYPLANTGRTFAPCSLAVTASTGWHVGWCDHHALEGEAVRRFAHAHEECRLQGSPWLLWPLPDALALCDERSAAP